MQHLTIISRFDVFLYSNTYKNNIRKDL